MREKAHVSIPDACTPPPKGRTDRQLTPVRVCICTAYCDLGNGEHRLLRATSCSAATLPFITLRLREGGESPHTQNSNQREWALMGVSHVSSGSLGTPPQPPQRTIPGSPTP
jgi:hypothetical protein